MTNKELIELYHTCDARKDCNGCPHEHDERCAIDDVNPDTLVRRLEALMAENELLYREVAQLKAECDHFRDLTKKLWCEKQYGEAMNVPTKWVSVDERLPEMTTEKYDDIDGEHEYEKSVSVIGASRYGEVVIVWYTRSEDGEGQWEDEPGTEYDITHWQPLPEPPSTEGSPTGQKG